MKILILFKLIFSSVTTCGVTIVGGADKKSKLIVGHEKGKSATIAPMKHILSNVYEVSETVTVFPDEKGEPLLHMHIACSRNTNTITGCVRWKGMAYNGSNSF